VAFPSGEGARFEPPADAGESGRLAHSLYSGSTGVGGVTVVAGACASDKDSGGVFGAANGTVLLLEVTAIFGIGNGGGLSRGLAALFDDELPRRSLLSNAPMAVVARSGLPFCVVLFFDGLKASFNLNPGDMLRDDRPDPCESTDNVELVETGSKAGPFLVASLVAEEVLTRVVGVSGVAVDIICGEDEVR
jgi:hypothetical protein